MTDVQIIKAFLFIAVDKTIDGMNAHPHCLFNGFMQRGKSSQLATAANTV